MTTALLAVAVCLLLRAVFLTVQRPNQRVPLVFDPLYRMQNPQSTEGGKQIKTGFGGKAAILNSQNPSLVPTSSASNSTLLRIQGRSCIEPIDTDEHLQ